MIVYTYDEDGYFSGEHACQENPREGGFVYPPRYLTVEPPTPEEDYQFVKKYGNSWVIESTIFGKSIYSKEDGSMIICQEKTLPEGFTTKEKPKENYYKWDDNSNNWIKDFTLYKEFKTNEIINIFNTFIDSGKFQSVTLGIEVDCRRSSTKNDLQNVKGLISNMTRNSLTEITYVGYSETVTATKEDLESLCYEMEDYVLNLYNTKWEYQTLVNNATSITQLDAISWE